MSSLFYFSLELVEHPCTSKFAPAYVKLPLYCLQSQDVSDYVDVHVCMCTLL